MNMPRRGGARPPLPATRPGCVTALALLLMIGAAAVTLLGLRFVLTTELRQLLQSAPQNYLAVGLLLAAALALRLAYGLWLLRPWARLLTILGLALVAAPAFSSALIYDSRRPRLPLAPQPPAFHLWWAWAGLALTAYGIYWFSAHRAAFAPPQRPPDQPLSRQCLA